MRPEKCERWSWHFGVALATFSGFVFTANNALTQYFNIDAIQILLMRSAAQVVIVGLVAKLSGVRDTIIHFSKIVLSYCVPILCCFLKYLKCRGG